MNRSCGIMLLGLIATSASLAQITVTQSSVEAIFGLGKRIELHVDTTSDRSKVDVGQKGGPHTYDFSDIKLGLFHADTLKSVSQFPELASRFSSSGVAFTIPNEFDGLDLDAIEFVDGKMVTIGSYRQNDTTEFTYRNYNPPELWFSFPVEFGDSLRDNTEHTDSTFKDGTFTNVGVYMNPMDHVVDGFGTLILPDDESHQCIRLRKREYPPYNYKGFSFLTNDGVFLTVGSRNTEPDEDSVSNKGIIVVRGDAPTSVETFDSSPKGFSLQQNYPNPFNPATTIAYDLPFESDVTLKIFNVLGQHVASLVDGRQSAGRYAVRWKAAGHPSGVYFYSLRTSTYSRTMRLLLLR